MKRCLILILAAAGLPAALLAQATHLDIMVPEIKDTDLKGPVKSVELKVWRNVSDEYTLEKSEYDRAGNLLKMTEHDKDGKLIETTTYFYDENGCYIRKLYKDEKDADENNWEVILNPETRQIARRGDDGRICIETYSPEGYLVCYRQKDKDQNSIFSREYKRDESNRRIKYTYLRERKPIYTYYYKWADTGFIDMEAQTYHQEDAKRRHTYEYLVTDEHDNWTQRIMVRYDIGGKKPVKVYESTVQRKIEYFTEEERESAVDTEAGGASTNAVDGGEPGMNETDSGTSGNDEDNQ